MQALRTLTNFDSFREKSWQWCQIATNKLHNLLVLVNPQSFYFQHFFHNFEFSNEISKSKSINLTYYFNTLIFKLSRFKMNFRIVFENFSADRWYQLSDKYQGCLLMKDNSKIIFHKSYEILKRMEYLAKNAFSSFRSIRWKLFKQIPL